MTKYLPADAQRPAYGLPPRPGMFRTPSQQAPTPLGPRQPEKIKTPAIEDVAEDVEVAPPAKRRKIDSPGQDANPSHAGGLHNGPWEGAAGLLGDGVDPDYLQFYPKPTPTGTAPPLPLPTRPWKHKMLLKEPKKEIKSIPRVRHDVTVPTTPCKLQNPDDGPFVNAPSIADFFPWTGNHPEDVLSEQTVKNGHSDKPPQLWNESNTARTTIVNTFKHRFGLQTLSALYGSAIQQRAQNQRISSSSAFKPPPRVTLTEAKRKAWLSDLANSAVPLRRLSRTIPQGIRGQLLLEQCLTNAVPISRAIWFAKCVAANEIRTLKRKGTSPTFAASAEAKWSKDWTTNIHQFIEALAKDCGKQDWRASIGYCLRLTTRLYTENLLDRDCFLDWTLTSTENSASEQLPVWLMVLHIYSKDLTRSRRRGGRLAAVLVDKLRSAQATDQEEPNCLVEKLKKFVRDVALSRPKCFLMPQKWQQCEAVVRQCLLPDVKYHQKVMAYLRHINRRAAGPIDQPEVLPVSPRQSVIQLLDAARAPYKVHQLANECSRACEDDDLRLMTAIEWSCTRFRHGEARLYLAVRLLRLWHRNRCDLDGVLHKFLANRQSFEFLHSQALHRLVAELVRSHDFSVSKYLQWLAARGALRTSVGNQHRVLSASHSGSETGVATQLTYEPTHLLTEMPLLHLPDHVKNLRSTVLSRIGFDVDNEAAVLRQCRCFIAKQLQGICPEANDSPSQHDDRAPDLRRLAWTIKSELGHWLRGIVAACFPANGKASFPQAAPSTPEFTLDHFTFIRGVLEHIDDTSMLADVLCYASGSREEAILASVADSTNAHLESLSAIGALDDLHSRISQSYVSLKVAKISLPTLAISLLDLGTRHPDVRLPIRALQADIARGDKVTIAAYSPFSDGMAESLQQAGSTFVEDFEAVILSEPNMAEQTMTQMFELVVERLKKDHLLANHEESRDSLCLLLARLRVFRPIHFDRLMSNWSKSVVSSSDNSAAFLLLTLVNFSCLPVSAIVQNLQELQTDTNAAQFRNCRRAVAWLLCDCVASESLATEPARYRFRTLWSQYLASNATDALAILPVIKSEGIKVQPGFDIYRTNWMPALLSAIALTGSQCPWDSNSESGVLLEEGLGVLFQGDRVGLLKSVDVQTIIGLCDDFSLPFCQLQLRLTSAHPGARDLECRNGIVDALFSLAAKNSVVEDEGVASDAWLPLATAVNQGTAGQLRERAEQAFFAIDLPLLYGRPGASPLVAQSETSIARVTRYLDIVSKMAYTIPETGAAGMCGQLNEKFAAVWRALNVNSVPTATTPAYGAQLTAPPTSTPMSTDAVLVVEYLPLLLRLVCIHRRSLTSKGPSPVGGKQAQQDQVKLLILLVCIALHATVAEEANLAGNVFDVVATLVDDISEEGRATCARCLKDKMRDGRVHFLFGTMNTGLGTEDSGSTLQLVKEGKGVIGEWKVKHWELLEGGADTSLNLGLFHCRAGTTKGERL